MILGASSGFISVTVSTQAGMDCSNSTSAKMMRISFRVLFGFLLRCLCSLRRLRDDDVGVFVFLFGFGFAEL